MTVGIIWALVAGFMIGLYALPTKFTARPWFVACRGLASRNKSRAAEFRPAVESALKKAATRPPVRVAGDVHWSVVRLDPKHVRVTLIDPGYLEPSKREAEILLQHLDGLACTDILSEERCGSTAV